ncbi:MAG: 3-oxoacyl-ACP synthase [Bacteroidota bacterium]
MKDQVYAFCDTFVMEKILMIRKEMKRVQEALGSESKNTAGDKHETGRAMLQLEREKLGKRLFEAERMKKALQKVTHYNSTAIVTLGSLIETEGPSYYIAISAGKTTIGNTDIYCISSLTPLGQLFLGKKVGDSIHFNQQEYRITKIW